MFKRILLVDDNETDLYVHHRRIRQHDASIDVRQARDGLEAMALLRAREFWPDLVILDVNMPCLDGFGFLDGCQAEFADRPLNVVLALTSAYQDMDIVRADLYPAVKGHFIKPMTKDWFQQFSDLIEAPNAISI